MSQLPDADWRNKFNTWGFVLRDPIGMLHTLFYESDTIPYGYALNRNGCRQ
jgi:hypothetical protein